ncbi:unnamed protein product [Nippostrongylus brasiliensis]|uniref:Nucleotide exchange factor GrpE n=1 Tax=Nippostrongylus brasiliensis TaxID=27835 RepID=A0A0N4XH70_NIPBR|nr:unnamed protein product [Nippostrongylus brasiliensis]VDL65462.1 unnamed protein product [Nippostrongylus brasiliensis]
MSTDSPPRTPTPDDWSELLADDVGSIGEEPTPSRGDVRWHLDEIEREEDELLEQKAAQQYGRELQLQIEQLEKTPRPPFESIRHLRERLEAENDLYRKQFVWQMENSEF